MECKVFLGDVAQSISEPFDFSIHPRFVLINTSDVDTGKVINHDKLEHKEVKGQFKKAFRKNDLLYSEIRPINRRFAFIDFDPDDYVASTKLMVIRSNEELIRPKFLYYFLSSNSIVAYLQRMAESRSGTFPQITFSEVARIELALPSLNVQDRILKVIDLIQGKIQLNSRINDYLEQLLDSLFVDVIASRAEEWVSASLLDIANYKNGLAMQRFRPEGNDEGLPVLKIRELGQGYCGADTERCRSDIDESVAVHDGDLVFSWSGTLLLDFWAGGDAGLNQHLFKVTSDVYPSWFYYLWTKHHMRRFIALAKDRATTMGHIKRSALADSEIRLPPKAQMTELTDLFQPIVNEIISLKVQSRKLGLLRDTLLPKLMSGEIDVSKVNLTQLNNHLSECLDEESFAKCQEYFIRVYMFAITYTSMVCFTMCLVWKVGFRQSS